MARRKLPEAPPTSPAVDDSAEVLPPLKRPLAFCGCGNLMYPVRREICEQYCSPHKRAGGGTYVFEGGLMVWHPDDPTISSAQGRGSKRNGTG